jgi:hypothetical protein
MAEFQSITELIKKIILFVPIISALIMETIHENLKEDPEEEEEEEVLNTENAVHIS